MFDYTVAPSPGYPTPTGVKSIIAESPLTVFPNPSAGTFTVYVNESLSNAVLKISNMLGATVYTDTLAGKQKLINSNLPAGIYFVQVSTGSKQWMQKMVIQ